MNLIFMYGPPAVGKTTVGRQLATLTKYRFFYNHLTVPAAKAIFPSSHTPYPDPRYSRLLQRLRIDGLLAAAEAGFDTIFTVAYSGNDDDTFVAEVVHLFEARGGRVCFVQLEAPNDVLLQRVLDPSRQALHMGKMTEPQRLKILLETRDMRSSVKYPSVLRLNTEKLTPHQAAKQIVANFDL